MKNKDLLDEFRRFFKYIKIESENSCWQWTGHLDKKGYGTFCSLLDNGKHRTKSAHRISYIIHIGDIPDGMLVCHKCDIPKCVNPKHLFLGTHKDNTRDAVKKGRHFSPFRLYGVGSDHPSSKLSESDILKIREKTIWKFGEKAEMARNLGITKSNIQHIIKYKTWKHVT